MGWKKKSKTYWVRRRGNGNDVIMVTRSFPKGKMYFDVMYKEKGSYFARQSRHTTEISAIKEAKRFMKKNI